MKRSEVDALARLLDGESVPDEQVGDEARALAALGAAMQASAVRPRPEFRADLRAMLIEEARTQAAAPGLMARLRGRVNDTAERWRYSTRLAAASGAAAVALSGGGVAAAAQHALPGDALYPVKVLTQDARLAVVRDAGDRGERQLTLAAERAEDAAMVVPAGKQEAAADALRDADARTRDGARGLITEYQSGENPAALAHLREFSTSQRTRIGAIAPQLRGTAVVAASDALVVLDRIDARILALTEGCPGCAPDGSFDYSYIPPATEAFDPCPCVQATDVDTDAAPTAPTGAGDEPAPAEQPRQPADAPAADAPAPAGPGASAPAVPSAPRIEVRDPAPVDDATKAVEDTTNRVVDDVIKRTEPAAPPEQPLRDVVEDLGETVESLLP
jgi:hypothetical protein